MIHRRLHAPLVLALFVAACGGDGAADPATSGDGGPGVEAGPVEAASTELVLGSPTFADGSVIPTEYRCANSTSPAFTLGGGPAGTLSYALVMRDLTLGNLLHWVLYDIPLSTRELPEGIPAGPEPGTPPGMKQGTALGTQYFGPCGPANTYEFALHAVDVATLPGVTADSSGADVVSAIETHSLATAKLTAKAGP